jgi:quinol monooxygenase YgiN
MFCAVLTVNAEPGRESDVEHILIDYVQNKIHDPEIHVIRAYRSYTDSRRFMLYHEFETKAGLDADRATKSYSEEIMTRLYSIIVTDDFVYETYDSL